ncbi:phosphohydrolase [Longibacter salinarum]|uniref:Phosphohydrolase n=1 Tax=Longibacter salinarum TaxID=1850348 RepID=A0A2A8CYD4_9BACT|nr:HD domain-containing protein [Longibacter salinarum]PEN13705.1 phosphohydrolase [Longibacter salinarum]
MNLDASHSFGVQAGADPFSPLIELAIELAAEWHQGQHRKGRWRPPTFEYEEENVAVRVPVMAHLTSVASIVQRAGWPDPVVAAAYLHDILEDRNREGQYYDRSALIDAVGEEVTGYVETLTETKLGPDGSYLSWRERKEEYIQQIREGTPEAAGISLADKLHNLWTMNQSLDLGINIFADSKGRKGLSAGPERQLWFYSAVLEATREHEDPRLPPMRERLQYELDRFKEFTAR